MKNQKNLSDLWIPDPKDFVEVPELPVLSTVKLDLREIKNIALLALLDNYAWATLNIWKC